MTGQFREQEGSAHGEFSVIRERARTAEAATCSKGLFHMGKMLAKMPMVNSKVSFGRKPSPLTKAHVHVRNISSRLRSKTCAAACRMA